MGRAQGTSGGAAAFDAADPELLGIASGVLARRLGGSPDEWLGEAWMCLRRGEKYFRPGTGHPFSYAKTIAERRAVDVIRKRIGRKGQKRGHPTRQPLPLDEALAEHDRTPAPHARLIARERLRRAERAVGRELRLAATGSTMHAIALATGTPIGTVKRRIHLDRKDARWQLERGDRPSGACPSGARSNGARASGDLP